MNDLDYLSINKIILLLTLTLLLIQTSFAQNAKCITVELGDKNNPVLKKTCTYQNIKVISTGIPDDLGRYSWSENLFINDNGQEKEIVLSRIFGKNKDRVQTYLNKEVMVEYKREMQDPELIECLKTIKLRDYSLDEFRLAFPEKKLVYFWIDGRTSGACRNVSLGLATMTYEQFNSLIDYHSE